MEKPKFKVGDRVRVKKGEEGHFFWGAKDGVGVITHIDSHRPNPIELSFPDFLGVGHSLNQIAKPHQLVLADNGIERARKIINAKA